MNMYRPIHIIFLLVIMLIAAPLPAIAAEQKIALRNGSSLYIDDRGGMRMEDAAGVPFRMKDDVVMETAEGELLLMKNKRLWKRHRHKAPTAGHRPDNSGITDEVVRLKGGGILVIGEKGDMRMQDSDGKPIAMPDGVEMETEDGKIILMRNKRLWRPFRD